MRVLLLSLFLALCTSAAQAQNLIAHWPMDDGAGTTVTEVVGGADGTLFNFPADGSQWQPGYRGGALSFDGIDDYVQHNFSVPEQAGTLAHWILPVPNHRGIIYYESDFPNGLGDYNGFGSGDTVKEFDTAWLDEGNRFVCYFMQDGSPSTRFDSCNDDYVNEGGWTHVAITWDQLGDVRLYVNCELTTQSDFRSNAFGGRETTQSFFGRPSEFQFLYNGLLDDVRVYDGALPPEEVRQFCDESSNYQSSIATAAQDLWAGEYVDHLCAELVEHGTSDVKDVQLIVQNPYGGGFIEEMERAFGVGGDCEGISWVAGAATSANEPSRGWSLDRIAEEPPESLGSPWTQAIAGAGGNVGGAPGAIRDGSSTNSVREDLIKARDLDLAGPNGLDREDPQVATGNGGSDIAWTTQQPGGVGIFPIANVALMNYAFGTVGNERHVNNNWNLFQALQATWEGQSYSVRIVASPSGFTVLGDVSMAVDRLNADTQLLLYLTGEGGRTLDFEGHYCELTTGPIAPKFDCVFYNGPGWFRGVFGNYFNEPPLAPNLTFNLHVTECDRCDQWAYYFNGFEVPFALPAVPGWGQLALPVELIRPDTNRLTIKPPGIGFDQEDSEAHSNGDQHGAMTVSEAHITLDALEEIPVWHTLQPGQSGAYWDSTRDGEGLIVELLENGLAAVIMFTYSEDGNEQAWALGVGEMVGDTIIVTRLSKPEGPSFGDDYDPNDRFDRPFGGLAFKLPGCGNEGGQPGQLLINPAVEWEGWEALENRNYSQLTQVLDCEDSGAAEQIGLDTAGDNAGLSGSWFDPSHDGEGIVLEVLQNDLIAITWFTYEEDGDQMWVAGVGSLEGDTLTIDNLQRPLGAEWGPNFDPERVDREPWGSLEMTFTSCDTAQLTYQSEEFGNGEQQMQRLTALWGASCDGTPISHGIASSE